MQVAALYFTVLVEANPFFLGLRWDIALCQLSGMVPRPEKPSGAGGKLMNDLAGSGSAVFPLFPGPLLGSSFEAVPHAPKLHTCPAPTGPQVGKAVCGNAHSPGAEQEAS